MVNDQGSDDRSGVFALSYHTPLQLNMTAYWDPAHGSWRDILRMVKSCGHYSFMLLTMVTVNLPHGPESSDMRFQQLKEAMSHHFAVSSPSTSPLFSALAPRMMEEMKADVGSDCICTMPELWKYCKNKVFYTKKGYKANLNRFHSVISEGHALLKKAALLLYQTQYLSIEMNFLTTRVWNFQMQCQLRGRDPQAVDSTGDHRNAWGWA